MTLYERRPERNSNMDDPTAPVDDPVAPALPNIMIGWRIVTKPYVIENFFAGRSFALVVHDCFIGLSTRLYPYVHNSMVSPTSAIPP
jgi:hypothetical protein